VSVPLPLAGGVRGGPVHQRTLDDRHNSFDILQHLIVPETKYGEAPLLKEARTGSISACVPIVLTAIDFNHELGSSRYEITDERPIGNWLLKRIPATCLARSRAQSARSASVAFARNSRDRIVGLA